MAAGSDRWSAESAWLGALSRRLVGEAHAADLRQDVLLAALRQPENGLGRRFLAAIARNLAVSLRRRESVERRHAAALPSVEHAPPTDDLVASAELQRRVLEEVMALPPIYRDTVLRRFMADGSVERVARDLGVTIDAVRTRQKRALAMLRERLRPDERRGMGLGPGLPLVLMMGKKISSVAALLAVGFIAWFVARPAWQGSGVAADLPATGTRGLARADDDSGRVDEAGPVARDPFREASRQALEMDTGGSAAPEPGRLQLRTVGGDGLPIGGLQLLVRDVDGMRRWVTTDARGRAELVAIEPGRYTVQAHDHQHHAVEVPAGGAADVVVALAGTLTARGVVLDARGVPVVGADILVSAGGIRPQWTFVAGRSDGRGRFEVQGLRELQLVGARDAQLGTSTFELLQEAAAAQVVLRLAGGAAEVAGRVVDSRGKAIAGCRIEIGVVGESYRPDASGRVSCPPPPTHLIADVDGRFAASGLRPASYRLLARARGFAHRERSLELGVGARERVDVVLEPGCALRGVVRSASGEPVGGARVWLAGWPFPDGDEATAGDDGTYALRDLPRGGWKVHAAAEGCGPAEAELSVADAEERHDFVLEPAARVSGVLVDDHGAPLVGWFVRSDGGGAFTDGAGAFVLDAPADRPEVAFAVYEKVGFTPVVARFTARAEVGARAAQVFRVRDDQLPSAFVHGRVVDDAGAPLAGVRFELEQAGFPIVFDGLRSAADGTFRVGPLPPGSYEIMPHQRPRAFVARQVELVANEQRDLGDVPGGPAARLRVEVVGDRADECSVQLYRRGQRFRRSIAVADGAAVFEWLFPESFEVAVTLDGVELYREAIDLDAGADRTLRVAN